MHFNSKYMMAEVVFACRSHMALILKYKQKQNICYRENTIKINILFNHLYTDNHDYVMFLSF